MQRKPKMAYTVNKLAKLSRVSIRTLRYYDEIGLLKPAFYGDNNYRYYEEEQLLILQQILFYRELGFPLKDIQDILHNKDFNKIDALISHKQTLGKDLDRTKRLIKTIDKTILHLRGKITMHDEDLFAGFDPKKQKEYETYLTDSGKVTQDQIDNSWKKVKHWKKEDWEKFKREGNEVWEQFVLLINKNCEPSSTEAQALVRRFYDLIKIFWIPDKASFIGITQLYNEHPDFRKFYDKYHPKLVSYLTEAIKIFAERELS